MAARITAADLPPRSAHRHLILRWLLDHPGEQARRYVVDGAVNLGRFPSEWRALPSTHASRRYASAVHQDVYFLIWDLRDERIIEAPMYRLTRRGRRESLAGRRQRHGRRQQSGPCGRADWCNARGPTRQHRRRLRSASQPCFAGAPEAHAAAAARRPQAPPSRPCHARRPYAPSSGGRKNPSLPLHGIGSGQRRASVISQ